MWSGRPVGPAAILGSWHRMGAGGWVFSPYTISTFLRLVLNCLNKSHFLLISITISKVKNVFLKILIEMQQHILMREMVS